MARAAVAMERDEHVATDVAPADQFLVLDSQLLAELVPALAASCAFVMPVATPPNTIVDGSSFISVPQMIRAGIFLNLTLAALTAGLGLLLVRFVFGVWRSCWSERSCGEERG